MKTVIRLFAFGFVSISTSWLLAQAEAPNPPHGDTEHSQHQHSTMDPNAAESHSHAGGSMAQMQQMMAHMQASDAQLDALLAEMNGATGEKKVEAMAALLNRLMQERKEMHHNMAGMQMMGQMMGMGTRQGQPQQQSGSDHATHGTLTFTDGPKIEEDRVVERVEAQAQRAVEQIRREAERAVAEARQQAERATAEAHEIAVKAAAERDQARRQVEEALSEAHARVAKAAAVQQEAQRAIQESRKQAELAAAAREQAVQEAERATAAERTAAERAAAEERARREAEKKSNDPPGKRP